MITKLRLQRFKNFRDATLELGPFTLLIGANASGKSNLRDAFRFLHGIGRGYTLADIIGEKYGEGGERLWSGIRGGIPEIITYGETTARLAIHFFGEFLPSAGANHEITFGFAEDDPEDHGGWPVEQRFCILSESLVIDGSNQIRTIGTERLGGMTEERNLVVEFRNSGEITAPREIHKFRDNASLLSQLAGESSATGGFFDHGRGGIEPFSGMRFLEPGPDAMRKPSFPGQDILGDHGENLSSVLHAIWKDEALRGAVVDWIRCLTPLDVKDLEFTADQVGRVLVTLVEANGQKTSAYSASDGTLRFLAMIAALYGPRPPRFIFLEEIDTGIHPARLHLLFDLIEQRVRHGEPPLQIVATTHAPQVLDLLSERMREFASVVYRCEGENEAHVRRVLDFPNVREIMQDQGLARLHGTGWFEHIAAFERAGAEDGP